MIQIIDAIFLMIGWLLILFSYLFNDMWCAWVGLGLMITALIISQIKSNDEA